jgi:hypothetical protein
LQWLINIQQFSVGTTLFAANPELKLTFILLFEISRQQAGPTYRFGLRTWTSRVEARAYLQQVAVYDRRRDEGLNLDDIVMRFHVQYSHGFRKSKSYIFRKNWVDGLAERAVISLLCEQSLAICSLATLTIVAPSICTWYQVAKSVKWELLVFEATRKKGNYLRTQHFM